MNLNKIIIGVIITGGLLSVHSNCSKTKKPDPGNPPPTTGEITAWITKGDRSALLQKQTDLIAFNTGTNSNSTIVIDSTQVFKTIDGFGYNIIGTIALLIKEKKTTRLN